MERECKIPSSSTALIDAIRNGRLEEAEHLIKEGADPNLPGNYYGLLPLHAAIESFNFSVSMLEMLIRNGADVNQISNRGDTALRRALELDNKEAVKVIKANGGKKKGFKTFMKNRTFDSVLLPVVVGKMMITGKGGFRRG